MLEGVDAVLFVGWDGAEVCFTAAVLLVSGGGLFGRLAVSLEVVVDVEALVVEVAGFVLLLRPPWGLFGRLEAPLEALAVEVAGFVLLLSPWGLFGRFWFVTGEEAFVGGGDCGLTG